MAREGLMDDTGYDFDDGRYDYDDGMSDGYASGVYDSIQVVKDMLETATDEQKVILEKLVEQLESL